MQRLSRDRKIVSGSLSRCPKDERRKRRSVEERFRRGNSNGEEGGRYAITNGYFRVIVRGAMKGTTCNYHCCRCIGRYLFFFLSFISIPSSLPRGNANFCVLRKQGPLSTITLPRVLRHANRAYRYVNFGTCIESIR